MKNVPYNEIGKTYNSFRKADPRIVKSLQDFLELPLGSTIADIGAGTGNYSTALANIGFNVLAVEPSEVMRNQAVEHENLQWFEGIAENIPLDTSSVDGVICTLAAHHFTDLQKAFLEMSRILKKGGKAVLFISDPRQCSPESCWLMHYFKPIFEQSYQVYKPLDEITRLLTVTFGTEPHVHPFLLPPDTQDGFFISAWKHPERYLDPVFQAGVSPLAKAPKTVIEPILQKLQSDLDSGHWQEMFPNVAKSIEYEGGYRFVVSTKS